MFLDLSDVLLGLADFCHLFFFLILVDLQEEKSTSFAAWILGIEYKKFANLSESEAEALELLDALEPNNDIGGVAPMQSLSAIRCLDEAKLFIIPDGSSSYPKKRSKFTDFQQSVGQSRHPLNKCKKVLY